MLKGTKNYIFGIVIFIILIILFISILPAVDYLNNYTLTFYLINYSYGFIPRGFIGTIFLIFNAITKNKIIIGNFIFIVFFISLISYILNVLFKKYKFKSVFLFISLLCLFNPASITLIYSNLEFGRFDIYIYMLSIISLILIYKKKYLWLIPLISIIGILIHENYLLYFSPLICMVLIYKYFKTKDNIFIFTLIINIMTLFIALFSVKYIAHLNYNNPIIFFNTIQEKTDFNLSISPISDYYFNTEENTKNLFKIAFNNQHLYDFIFAGVEYIIFFILLWNICFKYIFNKNSKVLKYIFLLTIISCLSACVLFFVGVDYGRWYVALINALVFLLVFFYFEEYEIIYKNRDKIKKWTTLILVLLLIFIFFYQIKPFYLIRYYKIDSIIEFFKNLTINF